MDLQNLTESVNRLVIQTGEFIRHEVDKLKMSDIETKSSNNFVTYVDKTSEEMLVEGLSKILPGSGFIAEENLSLKPGELTWVIDPLDGTTNFIHGVPLYSISVALMRNDEVISGVIYEINMKECFFTWKEASSYLNGKPIRVSNTVKLTDCLFATGFPYYDYGRLEAYIHFLKFMMKNSHGIRRLGTAAADLAWVACGRFDGFYEYGLSPWDVAAGSLIVKNAGGVVSDFRGGNDFIFGREILTTNLNVYPETLNAMKDHFLSIETP